MAFELYLVNLLPFSHRFSGFNLLLLSDMDLTIHACVITVFVFLLFRKTLTEDKAGRESELSEVTNSPN